MRNLFLFSIFTIIYGSLFPFQFEYIDWATEGREVLFSTSLIDAKFSDLISNILLFAPFGYAGSFLISRNNKKNSFYYYLYIYGFILALTVQALQVYIPSRVPALYDAV